MKLIYSEVRTKMSLLHFQPGSDGSQRPPKAVWSAWYAVPPADGGGFYREHGVDETQAINRLITLCQKCGFEI